MNLTQVSAKDYPVDRSKKTQPCPVCSPNRKNNKARCLTVYDDGAYCFHCEVSITFDETIKYEWTNYTQLSVRYAKAIEARGISQQTIMALPIKDNKKELIFEFKLNDNIVATKYRGPNKSFRFDGGSDIIPWNINAIYDSNSILIVEGEFDLMAMYEAGYKNVISVPNGASTNLNYLEPFKQRLDELDQVVIAVDNDAAGERLKMALRERFDGKTVTVDFGAYKDANEYLQKKGAYGLAKIVKEAIGLTPVEEIMSMEVNEHSTFEQEHILLKLQFSELFAAGELSAIVGAAKSRKTFLTSLLIDKMIKAKKYDSQNEQLFTGDFRGTILWFDTEQSKRRLSIVRDRFNGGANHIKFFAIKSFGAKKRRKLIEAAIEHYKPSFVVIDGIRDLLTDFNNIEECSEVMDFLMKTVDTTGTHILSILHTNPGSDKPRGHLGSEVLNKCSTTIHVAKEDEQSVVKPLAVRDLDFNEFRFTVVDGKPMMVQDVPLPFNK